MSSDPTVDHDDSSTVEERWTEILADAGVTQSDAELIAAGLQARPEIALGALPADDLERRLEAQIDELDFEQYGVDDPATVRDEMKRALREGIDGEVGGPSAFLPESERPGSAADERNIPDDDTTLEELAPNPEGPTPTPDGDDGGSDGSPDEQTESAGGTAHGSVQVNSATFDDPGSDPDAGEMDPSGAGAGQAAAGASGGVGSTRDRGSSRERDQSTRETDTEPSRHRDNDRQRTTSEDRQPTDQRAPREDRRGSGDRGRQPSEEQPSHNHGREEEAPQHATKRGTSDQDTSPKGEAERTSEHQSTAPNDSATADSQRDGRESVDARLDETEEGLLEERLSQAKGGSEASPDDPEEGRQEEEELSLREVAVRIALQEQIEDLEDQLGAQTEALVPILARFAERAVTHHEEILKRVVFPGHSPAEREILYETLLEDRAMEQLDFESE